MAMKFETNWMELELTLRFPPISPIFDPPWRSWLFPQSTRIIQKSSPSNVIFQLVLIFISSSSPFPYFSSLKSGSVVPKYKADTRFTTRRFPPWPFAVLLKQRTPFTTNDGIMQHSDQTSISQSFYPNLWSPDSRNKCFREDLRENFVPWDLSGQRYSPEHVLLHILYNNAS